MENITDEKLGDVGQEASQRPENRFKLGRLLALVGCVLLVCGFSAVVINNLSHPTSGMDSFGNIGRKTPTLSTVGMLGDLGRATPTLISFAPSQSNRPPTSLDCTAVTDLENGRVVIPAASKILATGFTFSGSGMVEVSGFGWVSQGWVRCSGDLRILEKPYIVTVTPTFLPSPTIVREISPVATATARIIYLKADPLPTYTPYPTPSGFGYASSDVTLNGMWFDGAGCLHVSIYGVKEIYVNDAAASGGSVFCDVRNFKVVVQ